jgi:hypothetical protein
MQHAPTDTFPAAGPRHRTAGGDWARDEHAMAVVDASGQVVDRFTVSPVPASATSSAGSPSWALTRSRSSGPTARSWTPSSRLV